MMKSEEPVIRHTSSGIEVKSKNWSEYTWNVSLYCGMWFLLSIKVVALFQWICSLFTVAECQCLGPGVGRALNVVLAFHLIYYIYDTNIEHTVFSMEPTHFKFYPNSSFVSNSSETYRTIVKSVYMENPLRWILFRFFFVCMQ